VSAASAIARAAIAAQGQKCQSINALELLDRWVDDATDEALGQISTLIFDERTDVGLPEVSWWALRTATSSVGNCEAGWALAGTCRAAHRAGLGLDDLREIAARAVMLRRRSLKPGTASDPMDR
jgi:hypothetical protein